MQDLQPFTGQFDYEVPLLRLLDILPGGQGKTDKVCRLFESEYQQLIPKEHYERRRGKEPLWRNNVRWCRQNLKQRGLLDAPMHGVWRITDTGRKWLEKHPQTTHIKDVPMQMPKKPHRKARTKKPSTPGITLDMLEQTRKNMSTDKFRQVWGTLYDQLLAEERTKAITTITQTELGRRTRRRLDAIHAFLRGEITSTPSSDVLCDWIHFCYALELHREATALLPYVCQDEVDTAIYKRAKRIAEVCSNKLTIG